MKLAGLNDPILNLNDEPIPTLKGTPLTVGYILRDSIGKFAIEGKPGEDETMSAFALGLRLVGVPEVEVSADELERIRLAVAQARWVPIIAGRVYQAIDAAKTAE